MKKFLEINLYDGDSKLVDLDDDLRELLDYIKEEGNYKKGNKEVWLGEEFMYIKVNN